MVLSWEREGVGRVGAQEETFVLDMKPAGCLPKFLCCKSLPVVRHGQNCPLSSVGLTLLCSSSKHQLFGSVISADNRTFSLKANHDTVSLQYLNTQFPFLHTN